MEVQFVPLGKSFSNISWLSHRAVQSWSAVSLKGQLFCLFVCLFICTAKAEGLDGKGVFFGKVKKA